MFETEANTFFTRRLESRLYSRRSAFAGKSPRTISNTPTASGSAITNAVSSDLVDA